MDVIKKYFPELSEVQLHRMERLKELYAGWNEKINVVSRKDIDLLYLRHVLHSLAIAKVFTPLPGARILDVGTGGGFPGIPLAIIFPQARFTLVDSIGKKIKVAQAVAAELGLENVETLNARAEGVTGKFDYVVSRAVTEMKTFLGWVWNKIERGSCGQSGEAGSAPFYNGVLCLKGGELDKELSEAGEPYAIYNIGDFFAEEFFETKKVVYIPK